MRKLRSLFVLDLDTYPLIYGDSERHDIASRVHLLAPPQTKKTVLESPFPLSEVDAIFSGWGAPLMDEAFLQQAPNLKVVFYGAGAIGGWITDAVWQRGIRVTSAHTANSVPVAEFTLAMIILSLKHAWSLIRQTREQQTFVPRNGAPGCYGATIGLISMGAVAKELLPLLRPLNVDIVAYDPFLSSADAARMGVRLTSLNEVFEKSDIVSLHAPQLPSTIGLVSGALLNSMKPGATFINTARGAIVRETEMIEVLARRPDLHAVLDVTDIEPPLPGSPLYTLPNVTLTPHIAGSVGRECSRMGRYMVQELDRYLAGLPMRWEIKPTALANTSHQQQTSKKLAVAV